MGENGREMILPAYVRRTLATLEAAGHQAYCVGGCVRDSLLGREPGDWDVAASALPEETLAVFGNRAVPTGLKHGTVTVCWDEGRIEITTFRRDGVYTDHRHPEAVIFTPSLTEDLARRDFTVNAMAVDLRGVLHDPFGGQADLADGVLRCVGDPERRFTEDALRILRCLRFSSVLGFFVEEKTAEALSQCRGLLAAIAPERIWTELEKLLCGPDAAAVLRRFPEVVGVFWPEAAEMVGFEQHNIHHCYDVWEHALHALAAVPPVPVLRCAALLHDVGKPRCFTMDENGVGHFYGHGALSRDLANEMLRRMRCSNDFRETVVTLVEWHDRDIPRSDRAIRRALGKLGEDRLRLLIALKRADNLAQAPAYWGRQAELDRGEGILNRLIAENACVSLRQLAVNGRDLTELGFSGPAVGRALRALLDAVTEEWLPNDRAALLNAARTMEK